MRPNLPSQISSAPEPKKRKWLVWLIVLLLLFLLLLAFLFAGVINGPISKNIAQSRTTISSFVTASNAYLTVYGKLPQTGTASAIVNSGTLFVNCMLGNERHLNERGIRFLDLPQSLLKNSDVGQILLDPFGTPYSIYYDTNGDGFVSEADAGTPKFARGSISGGVAIWSWGPNRTNDWGGGDDIKNWIRPVSPNP